MHEEVENALERTVLIQGGSLVLVVLGDDLSPRAIILRGVDALADVVGELRIACSWEAILGVDARLAFRAAAEFAGTRVDKAVSVILLRGALRDACIHVAALVGSDSRSHAAVRAAGEGCHAC